MAHAEEKRTLIRHAYVNELLSLTVAAVTHGVPEATARRWKSESRKAGDNWDLARAASRKAESPIGEFSTDFIEEFTIQIAATFDLLKEQQEQLSIDQRTKILGSLTDMMSKVMKVSGGNTAVAKRAVAADVCKKLAVFCNTHFPDFAPSLVELLGAFAPVMNSELDD
jgi:hypothetical protein